MAALRCGSQESMEDKLENLLINSAKETLNDDLSEAKAWLLTARVLYPHKFGVQFLAYQMEKSANNLKDSAKSFAELLAAFPTEPDLCSEVLTMTSELRKFEENKVALDKAEYLVQLFYDLPQPVQRSLLLSCANNANDPLDYCKLMLLLFRKFHGDTNAYGMEVMERLVAAENRTSSNGNPLNPYRKILVSELLPFLTRSQIDLPKNSLLRLLNMAVEFYVTYAFEGSKRQRREDRDSVTAIEDPWGRLWETILSIGTKLNWELSLGFSKNWKRDEFFKAQQLFQNRIDEHSIRQLAFCTLIVLLRCVHEYLPIVEPGNQEHGFILVEAFVQPDGQAEPRSKIRKIEEDPNCPLITAGSNASPLLVPTFLAAMRCYNSLHWSDILLNEYMSLCTLWKAEPWLQTFLVDAATIESNRTYDKILRGSRCEDQRLAALLVEINRLMFYVQACDNLNIVDTISKIAGLLSVVPTPGTGNSSSLVAKTRRNRHFHFLPITRAAILQYCVKVLLKILHKKPTDMALGHTLVLMQLNWSQEKERLKEISDMITERGGFTYSIFSTYIINIDILERFAYLAGPNGPKLPLDIFAGTQIHSQRRMSTRGIDKGAKEDFKMALRAQVARWNEPVDELIIRFLTCERDLICHAFIT